MKKFMMMLVLFAMLLTGCTKGLTFHLKMSTSWKPMTFFYNNYSKKIFVFEPKGKKGHIFIDVNGIPPMAPKQWSTAEFKKLVLDFNTAKSHPTREWAPHEMGFTWYTEGWIHVAYALRGLDRCFAYPKKCRLDNVKNNLTNALTELRKIFTKCTQTDSGPSYTTYPCDYNPPLSSKAFLDWVINLKAFLENNNNFVKQIRHYRMCMKGSGHLKAIHLAAISSHPLTGKFRLKESKVWGEWKRMCLCPRQKGFNDVEPLVGEHLCESLPAQNSCEYYGTRKIIYMTKDRRIAERDKTTTVIRVKPIRFIYKTCRYPLTRNFEPWFKFR